MNLTSGTRLGPYEILSALGSGGMGDVYRARDTRLDRMVAIKILSETLASDTRFRERFAREARAISQLDHPHICTLYDIGEQDGTAFLVMQLLEGETFAARLEKGPMPLDQALRCAIEIAGALDRAHRSGIVHRDLKPANIMLTRAGAMLLDFGLAKSAAGAAHVSGLSMLPTTPPGLTAQGTILGTFQYMAPEQLEGHEADARTDIFAFGAVLYEMVTGRRAFQGRSPASLIGAILKDEPTPIAAHQPFATPALDRIVRACLAKDPDDRWQSAGDLQRELKWIDERGADTRKEGRTASMRVRERVAWIVAVLALAATVGLAVFVARRPSPRPASIRFEILPPPGTSFASGPANPHHAVSPDGRRVVFAVIDASGRGVLAMRDLGELQSRVLTGTEGIRLGDTDADAGVGNGLPFWSPDSRFIGFFGGGALKKVEATGGPVQTLCSAGGGEGATWNEEGTIVFASTGQGGLLRVSANGGTPAAVTTLDPSTQETSHRWPWFLPDGRHFLYVAMPSAMLFVGSLDSQEHEPLFEVQSKALYAEGYLLFIRDGLLLAQPFDAIQRRVTGDGFPVAEDVGLNPATLRAALSVSPAGVLAYRTVEDSTSQLVWYDRSGQERDSIGEPGMHRGPQLSPDGTRVAIVRRDPVTHTRDVWVYDVTRGSQTRITFDPAEEALAIWSPDGSRLIFNSRRRLRLFDLFGRPADGSGTDAAVFADASSKFATSWTGDGRFVLYDTADPANAQRGDVWVLPVEGARKPIPVVQTPANEMNARISPDDKWIAYQSDESAARAEVYVVPFVAPSRSSAAASAMPAKRQVSVSGGAQPRWRGDGKELYYVAPGRSLMAVDVIGRGPSLQFGNPHKLFEIPRGPRAGASYDVAADGMRFLIDKVIGTQTPSPITVVVNWTANLGTP